MLNRFSNICILAVAMLVVVTATTLADRKMASGTIQSLDATKGMVSIREKDGQTVHLEAAPELLIGLQAGDAVQVRLSGKRITVIQKQEEGVKPIATPSTK